MGNLTKELFLAGARFHYKEDKGSEYQYQGGLLACERQLNTFFYTVQETKFYGAYVKIYFFGQVYWFSVDFKDCTIIEE